MDEDIAPRKKPTHELGQDLALLSVEELGDRVALLRAEVDRLEAEMSRKRASLAAASAFFKQ